MEFDNLVNLNYGMRNDVGEKYIPKEYFVNLDKFNFDSIIGLDKIKERTQVNANQLVSGKAIDGGWDYRYIDNSNNAQEAQIIVSGGSVFKVNGSTYTPIYSGLHEGRVSFATHQNKLFIANGLDYPIVYWGAKGITSQMGAPVIEDSGVAGNPNGTYYYACTFITDGGEEYIGTVSNTITVSSTQITVNLPIGYQGTNSRKLYRTTASGTILYQVAEIADNETLIYTDNTLDADLLKGPDLSTVSTSIWTFDEPSGTIAYDDKSLSSIVVSAGTSWDTPIITGFTNSLNLAGAARSYGSYNGSYEISTNSDFAFYFWTDISSAGLYVTLEDNGGSIAIELLFDALNGTRIQLGTQIATGPTITTGKYLVWVRRTAGVLEVGWNKSTDSLSLTPKISSINLEGFAVGGGRWSVMGNGGVKIQSLRVQGATTLTDANITYIFNNGSGRIDTFGGSAIIPTTNNELPKPYILQVADAKLAGCVSDKNPNQLWATATNEEVFDNANYVDVTSQSNDNTPLTGMVNDYKALVVASEKNIFLVDITQEPANVKLTRANTGCKNGYTMLNIPPYKAFEGGVLFLSALNDYRLFNSNFAQPIQATDMVIEEGQSGAWVRAVANTLKGLDSDKAFACFWDYKYHIAYGSTIMVFDLRNQGWTKYENQDANCMWTYQDNLYSGRTATSFVDKMYDSQTLDGDEFEATMETGALEADEEIKFFKDLYIYFKSNSYNELELQIIYEDDFQNKTLDIVKINTAKSGNYDPQNYDIRYFSVSSSKDDYVVYHINRWTRWIKFIITSKKGRFLYRGYRLVGERKQAKE